MKLLSIITYMLSGVFLWVLFLGNFAQGQVNFDELRENVEASESLYTEIDVKLEFSHQKTEHVTKLIVSSGNSFQPVMNRSDTIWFVSQSGMYRADSSSNMKLASGKSVQSELVKMYDGENSNFLNGGAIANLTKGYASTKNHVRPHMLLMKRPFYYMPLSVLLSGMDVLASSPFSEWPSEGREVEYQYLGETAVGDLLCHEVWITIIKRDIPRMKIELLLAEDRNFIPARTKWYQLLISKETPVEEAEVVDWLEVESGIWFPSETILVSYNARDLKTGRGHNVQWNESYKTQEVSLAPDYEVSFFRSLEIPDGTAVYEVSGGEITKSFRKGALSDPSASVKTNFFVSTF